VLGDVPPCASFFSLLLVGRTRFPSSYRHPLNSALVASFALSPLANERILFCSLFRVCLIWKSPAFGFFPFLRHGDRSLQKPVARFVTGFPPIFFFPRKHVGPFLPFFSFPPFSGLCENLTPPPPPPPPPPPHHPRRKPSHLSRDPSVSSAVKRPSPFLPSSTVVRRGQNLRPAVPFFEHSAVVNFLRGMVISSFFRNSNNNGLRSSLFFCGPTRLRRAHNGPLGSPVVDSFLFFSSHSNPPLHPRFCFLSLTPKPVRLCYANAYFSMMDVVPFSQSFLGTGFEPTGDSPSPLFP